ncbi:ZIP family metal transporter [Natronospira bacteriovora]|uniref:ZIP family metal transporter n=1 Tax=Natronospira bacteriovora TaxID=3069753 RepID=A0ABU0WBV8_9GAMM|nr:ZIP family metal transporter [Natronospira sp. AB-CW4]MDQ2070425.1 ZIP family metal transporter [Natronospira sp. AB-CW4]
MPETLQAMLFVALAGLSGSLLASLFLILPLRFRSRALPILLAFAVGALLGAAWFELIPHALNELDGRGSETVGKVFFLSLLLAFLLEKFLRWRQARQPRAHKPAGPMILLSDALHKFVDGVVVIAAWLTDPWLGLVTALAVIAHEVPHELGNIAVLLDSGYRRLQAFLLNLLASAAIIPGGLLALWWLGPLSAARPFVLVLAAALFCYIALAVLVPELHRETRFRAGLTQIMAILAGSAIIFLVHHLVH